MKRTAFDRIKKIKKPLITSENTFFSNHPIDLKSGDFF